MILERLRQNNIIKKVCAFQATPYYIACIAAIALLSHTFGLEIAAFWIIAITAVFTLVFNDDTTPFIPLAFFLVFCISAQNGAQSNGTNGILTTTHFLVNCILIVITVLAAFVFHIIYYKNYVNFKKRTMLSSGLIAMALGLLTNGFFYVKYTVVDLFFGLSFGLLYYGIYILFFHTIKWKKGVSVRYLAYVMFIMGLLISAELGVLYLRSEALRKTFDKGLVWLGWGLSNAIAFIFMLTIPFGFFLTHTSKFSLPYFLGTAVMLLAVVFTFSRGSLIIAVPLFVAGTIFVCLFAKNRLPLWIAAGVMLIIGVVIVISYREQLIKMLNFYIETGLNDRGRFDLWEEGLQVWLAQPIFGVGLMYKYGETFTSTFWFHNTLIQFLATGGLVGLSTYLYHRVQTVIMLVKKMSVERLFIGAAIACLLANSMLDVAMSCQHIIIFYGVILAFAEKDMLFCTGEIDENGQSTEGKGQSQQAAAAESVSGSMQAAAAGSGESLDKKAQAAVVSEEKTASDGTHGGKKARTAESAAEKSADIKAEMPFDGKKTDKLKVNDGGGE